MPWVEKLLTELSPGGSQAAGDSWVFSALLDHFLESIQGSHHRGPGYSGDSVPHERHHFGGDFPAFGIGAANSDHPGTIFSIAGFSTDAHHI